VLGTILDTGRDLIVGPGNENLSTQEQVTRAILNTIILAKAPQALPDVYAQNQLRDSKSLKTLGSPEFGVRVTELMNPSEGSGQEPLNEADAIKRAADEYEVSSGMALPAKVRDLPPADLGESLRYGKEQLQTREIANILTQPPAEVGRGVSEQARRMALLRRAYGMEQEPGGAAILKSIETVESAKVPDPSKPIWNPTIGQYVSPMTGQPIMSGAGGGPVGVPGTGPLPGSPDTATTPPRELTDENILAFADEAVPTVRPVTNFNPATQQMEKRLEEISPHEVEANRGAIANAYRAQKARIDASAEARIVELGKNASALERTYVQVNEAAVDLLQYVVTTDPKTGKSTPNYDVFTEEAFPGNAKGVSDLTYYKIKQQLRATSLGQGLKPNEQLALFVNRRGLAAQILARVITKDRVSEQDFATFLKTIPPVGTPRRLAEAMIRKAPEALRRIVAAHLMEEGNAVDLLAEWRTLTSKGATPKLLMRPRNGDNGDQVSPTRSVSDAAKQELQDEGF
jgi:hypothetical protein